MAPGTVSSSAKGHSATRILVTGAGGQLGRAVLSAAAARGVTALGAGHQDLPVEDGVRVAECILKGAGPAGGAPPTHVIHCGAWTDVDGCEGDPARAQAINGDGTGHLATACAEAGAGLVYVSTDFVFAGDGTEPYLETDPTAPLSEYGKSKQAGEAAVLVHGRDDFHVVRTSWVFGPGGKNFPKAIHNAALAGKSLKVVTDQHGRPTYCPDLAEALLDLALGNREGESAPGGVWHASNEGQCNWHRFAVDLLSAAGMGDLHVGEQTAADVARPAPRPAWSVLNTDKLTAFRGGPMPHYRDALERYFQAETHGETT